MSLQPLSAAAERGNRTLAHFFGVERRDSVRRPRLFRRRRLGRWSLAASTGCVGPPGTANQARTFILVAAVGGDGGRPRAAAAAVAAVRGRRCRGGRWSRLSPRAWPRFRRNASWLRARPSLGFLVRRGGVLPRPFAGFGGVALVLFAGFAWLSRRLASSSASATLFDLAHAASASALARAIAPLRSACATLRRNSARRAGFGGAGAALLRATGRLAINGSGACGLPVPAVAAEAALRLLDHHRLGAAVGEALAHDARLGPRLQRQSLAEPTLSVLSPGVLVSAIQQSQSRSRLPHSHSLSARP